MREDHRHHQQQHIIVNISNLQASSIVCNMNTIFSLFRVPSMPGRVLGRLLGPCRTLVTRPQLPLALAPAPTPLYGQAGVGGGLLSPSGILGGVSGRTNIRCHFPRPNERKRILRHGWQARMATRSGRNVLRRRILKGRHVLSH